MSTTDKFGIIATIFMSIAVGCTPTYKSHRNTLCTGKRGLPCDTKADSTSKALVKIKCGQKTGWGVVISPDGHILTASKLIATCKGKNLATVTWLNGTKGSAVQAWMGKYGASVLLALNSRKYKYQPVAWLYPNTVAPLSLFTLSFSRRKYNIPEKQSGEILTYRKREKLVHPIRKNDTIHLPWHQYTNVVTMNKRVISDSMNPLFPGSTFPTHFTVTVYAKYMKTGMPVYYSQIVGKRGDKTYRRSGVAGVLTGKKSGKNAPVVSVGELVRSYFYWKYITKYECADRKSLMAIYPYSRLKKEEYSARAWYLKNFFGDEFHTVLRPKILPCPETWRFRYEWNSNSEYYGPNANSNYGYYKKWLSYLKKVRFKYKGNITRMMTDNRPKAGDPGYHRWFPAFERVSAYSGDVSEANKHLFHLAITDDSMVYGLFGLERMRNRACAYISGNRFDLIVNMIPKMDIVNIVSFLELVKNCRPKRALLRNKLLDKLWKVRASPQVVQAVLLALRAIDPMGAESHMRLAAAGKEISTKGKPQN